MTDKTEKHTQDAKASVQPGDLTKQLKDCREKAGMDIEKAAESMHLSRSLVNALETEAFDELPEPPYIRGYLRSYAKLADMDPTPLIRTYEILRGADPDATAHHFAPATSINKVTSPVISPEAMRMLGITAMVILLGLLGMIPAVRNWAQDIWTSFSAQTQQSLQARLESEKRQYDLENSNTTLATTNSSLADQPLLGDDISLPVTSTTTTNTTTAQKADSATPTTQTVSSDNSVDKQKTTENNEKTTQPTPPITNTAVTNTDPKVATQTASTEKTGKKESTPETKPNKTNTPEKEADKPKTKTTTEKNPEAAEPKQPIDGSVTVRLEFIDEVWMEVRDKRGKKLFSALNSAGTIKEFNAHTPLSFKIGNARGVALYLNGQFYDTRPYITGGTVAKFRVE